jgi:hypothetical protein
MSDDALWQTESRDISGHRIYLDHITLLPSDALRLLMGGTATAQLKAEPAPKAAGTELVFGPNDQTNPYLREKPG